MAIVYSLAIECKSNEFSGEFFFCNLAVLAVIFRVRSNWFSISRIHWCGSFFSRSSLVSAYEYLFLQFRAQKGASLVFSECDKSTELMYIFSWTQKAIPVEPQCRRVKHWASEDYVIREMFLCQQLHWCVKWHFLEPSSGAWKKNYISDQSYSQV